MQTKITKLDGEGLRNLNAMLTELYRKRLIGSKAYLSTNQNINNHITTKVLFNLTVYNLGNCFDIVNNKFKVKIPGFYFCSISARFGTVAILDRFQVFLKNKDDDTILESSINNELDDDKPTPNNQDIIHFGKDEELTMYVYHTAGSNSQPIFAQSANTFMTIFLIVPD